MNSAIVVNNIKNKMTSLFFSIRKSNNPRHSKNIFTLFYSKKSYTLSLSNKNTLLIKNKFSI